MRRPEASGTNPPPPPPPPPPPQGNCEKNDVDIVRQTFAIVLRCYVGAG